MLKSPRKSSIYRNTRIYKIRCGNQRSAGDEPIEEALIPESLSNTPSTYGIIPYGMHWKVATGILQPGAGVASFGHPGSSGTIGWVVPEEGLIILYFRQSSGGRTHIKFVEEAIRRLVD